MLVDVALENETKEMFCRMAMTIEDNSPATPSYIESIQDVHGEVITSLCSNTSNVEPFETVEQCQQVIIDLCTLIVQKGLNR